MLAIIAASAFLFADSAPTTFILRPSLDVWDVVIVDLNNDLHLDILAFCSDSQGFPVEKTIVAFVADEHGAYSKNPTAVLPLGPSVGTAFIAETDGQPPKEIVVADHSGASVYRLQESDFVFVSRSSFTSLFPTGSTEPLFLPDSAIDLDGDGVDEWLVPVANGYEIRSATRLLAAVPAPIQSEIIELGTLAVQHRLPTIYAFDDPVSTGKGLALLSDRFADFAYGEDWSQHYRYEIPARLDERWEAYARMDDINNDGFPDLLVTQTRGVTNITTETQVYIAVRAFEYPDTPTAQFSSKGSFTTPTLLDINRDGQSDVVLMSVPLSLRNIVNFFLRGKVTVQIDVHLSHSGRFDTKPTYRKNLTMVAPEGRQRVAYAMGDFTGDGRIDLAMGITATKLAVYRGQDRLFLSSKPWITIDVPAFGIVRVKDLDRNGVEDIVLFHRSDTETRRIEVILF